MGCKTGQKPAFQEADRIWQRYFLFATAGRSISEQVAIGRSFSRQIAAAAGTGYYRFTTIQRTENPICAIRAFRSIEW